MLTEKRRRIRLLPPAIAERIAAGEVIERPASVVKELVENSLDAGATQIEVRLEEGGRSLIEVTDNGLGMDAEDLQLAPQRHATSKLESLDDLERLTTLGFRGEALPSIAAVSELTILSRARGADTAYQLAPPSKAPRPATHGHFLQSERGTRIQARGLFATVPARLKFLKSPASELSHVREWLERLALTAPAVGFALHSDGRAVLRLRPQPQAERVRAVLVGQDDLPVVEIEHDRAGTQKGIRARLLWVQGWAGPQSRKLIQVVNGRALKDRLLQQAMLSGFRQAMLPGQYPALALYLEVDPAVLDVNVHPTKAEVRFLESGPIFRVIQGLCHELIARSGAPAVVPAWSRPAEAPSPERGDAAASGPLVWAASEPMGRPARTEAFDFRPPAPPASDPAGAQAQAGALDRLLADAPYIGQVFSTFLLFDQGEELVSIDPHAAHERIRFEQLRRSALRRPGEEPVAAQALLVPEAVRLSVDRLPAFRSQAARLAELGFETEEFGEDGESATLLFRSVPATWGGGELRPRLVGLVERVSALDLAQDDPRWDSAWFEALASEACHSSVRANERLEREEALALAGRLARCEHPWNCPHGRPTVARIPRARFEEWFQRRPAL